MIPLVPKMYDMLDWRERRNLRNQYVQAQQKKCWYCNAPLDGSPSALILRDPIRKSLFPENFFKYPVHLHHCRKTGLTVGAVHNYCNAHLWQYKGE